MAFKLKKTSDNLFHKVSESKLDGGKVTQQPQVDMEAPSSAAKFDPISVGSSVYSLGKLAMGAAKKGAQMYSDYTSGKSAREAKETQKPVPKPTGADKMQAIAPDKPSVKAKPKVDKYANAAKKDSKLSEYVAKRKTLKKGSAEWNANQNKINKAYGVKKRYNETPATKTPTSTPKPANKPQATAPAPKKPVVKKETSSKASKIRSKGEAVLSDKSLSTEEKQRKALKLRRKYDKQNSKVEKKAKVKTAKVKSINAKADVADAKGKDNKASRLRAKAERKETGVSRKDQGRNIFGNKTRKQKKKEAEAKAKKGAAPDYSGMS